MGTTQDRFLAAVAAEAKALDLDYRLDPGYANTGTVRIHKSPDDFTAALVTFTFQFNANYASIEPFGKHKAFAIESGGLADALALITKAMTDAKRQVPVAYSRALDGPSR